MEEINFYDLVKYYVKNWLNLAIAILIGAIIGVGYTYFIQEPLYESKATLLVVDAQRSSSQDSVVINNYVGLFTSYRVLSTVIDEQGYNGDGSYNKLVSNTSASNPKGTDIINVSMSTPDPDQSSAMLESTIESFREQATDIYGDSRVRIEVVDGARTPSEPANVRPLVQIGLAAAAAVAVTIIGMFFVYDYRVSNKPQVKADKIAAAKATSAKKKPVAQKAKTTKPKATTKK